mmetsp:Transcript_2155/g.2676  ORF Transcript_2155/g.2676 Transcript_2155/m.2676 type:complete len:564 (-) Transcript_2155:99-1790(-)
MPSKKRKVKQLNDNQSETLSAIKASEGPCKLSLRFGGCIHEEHKEPIYSLSFFEPLPDLSTNSMNDSSVKPPCASSRQYFASVGSNRATIYTINIDGTLSAVQAFIDEDVEEIFYSSCWSISADDGINTPLLLIGGYRGYIKVIHCSEGKLETLLLGHGNAINDLRSHPVTPSLILSASKDESIRLWNVHTSCCIAIFAGDQGHRDQVLSIDFHILGNCFASCGMDNTIKLWSLEGKTPSRRVAKNIQESFDYHTKQPNSSVMTQNNNINSEEEDGVEEQNVSIDPNTNPNFQNRCSFKTIHEQFPIFSTCEVHSDYVDCVRWVGNLLLSKSTANKIIMWKPDVFGLHGHTGVAALHKVNHIQHQPLMTKTKDKPSFQKQKDEEDEDGETVIKNKINSISQQIVHVNKKNSNVNHENEGEGEERLKEGKKSTRINDQNTSVGEGKEQDDEELISSLVEPSNVCFPPKLGATNILKEFEFKDADIWFVRFSLDLKYQLMAVGNKFGQLWLWNVDGNPHSVLVKKHCHLKCNSAIRQTAFSPDGRYLVCCCENGSIWKWAIDYYS